MLVRAGWSETLLVTHTTCWKYVAAHIIWYRFICIGIMFCRDIESYKSARLQINLSIIQRGLGHIFQWNDERHVWNSSGCIFTELPLCGRKGVWHIKLWCDCEIFWKPVVLIFSWQGKFDHNWNIVESWHTHCDTQFVCHSVCANFQQYFSYEFFILQNSLPNDTTVGCKTTHRLLSPWGNPCRAGKLTNADILPTIWYFSQVLFEGIHI